MIKEDLPLFRAKLPGLYAAGGTGPGVGPGSYNLGFNSSKPSHGVAPFGTTSDRFALRHGTGTPGVGTYDVITEHYRKGDITLVPFASSVDRFFGPRADDVPGPGSYPHDGDRWGRSGRSHTIGGGSFGGGSIPSSLGPGSYNPNYGAGHCSNPRAANFGGYCGRDGPRSNNLPGPGHYNIPVSKKSVYNDKPSSMFATKTLRSTFGGNNKNPGPGAYNIPSFFQSSDEYNAINPESFSTFGSSAARHAPFGPTDSPGPGSYTGNIAPRRPNVMSNTIGTSSFVSDANRTILPQGTNIGPGAYESNKPITIRKHKLVSVPFRSQSERFPVRKTSEDDGVFEPRHTVVRVPRRIHPIRLQGGPLDVSQKINSRGVSPERVYDVKYDWTKPTCRSGAYLGEAPRFDSKDSKKDFPGPGHYNISEKPSLGGARSLLNRTWGTDGRFKSGSQSGTPGPGHYRYDSTFYKKSFNCTIGSSEDM